MQPSPSAFASLALGLQVYATMPGLNIWFLMPMVNQEHMYKKFLSRDFQEFPVIFPKLESIQLSGLVGIQTQNAVFILLLGFYTVESS